MHTTQVYTLNTLTVNPYITHFCLQLFNHQNSLWYATGSTKYIRIGKVCTTCGNTYLLWMFVYAACCPSMYTFIHNVTLRECASYPVPGKCDHVYIVAVLYGMYTNYTPA